MWTRLTSGEPEAVHTELVDALADSTVAMLILAGLIILFGCYVQNVTEAPLARTATAHGALSCALKIAVSLKHRRDLSGTRRRSPAGTRRLEIIHAASTLTVAGSVGFLTLAIFALPQIELHLAANSILFGYCAGVIHRISAQPRIALCALFCAGLPAILAEVRRLAQRIPDHLLRPHDLGTGEPVSIELRLGYAMGVAARTGAGDLMHRTDEASFIAKRACGGIRAPDGRDVPPASDPLASPRVAASA